MGHIAWGLTSVFANIVSHRSSAFFRVMRVIAFETQFTAVLHPGSLVSCHTSSSSSYILTADLDQVDRCLILIVILLVDSLYAEATEAVKSRAALSASTPDFIYILGDIKFEARL
jgi:hypothetical protein